MKQKPSLRSKPLGGLSDAVGIDVIAAGMPSLMQASEGILSSMTHPFGLQTVAKVKNRRSFLAKNRFARLSTSPHIAQLHPAEL